MKIHKIILGFLLLAIQYEMRGQNIAFQNNSFLFDSLAQCYSEDCINIKPRAFRKSKVRNDVRLIELLNKCVSNSDSLNSIENYLRKNKFTDINIKKDSADKPVRVVNYFRQGGNIRGFVKIKYRKNLVLSKSIIIATDTKVYCETTNNSVNYSYIDFIYLRRFLKIITFPLKVSSSNVELESMFPIRGEGTEAY